jgi:hypothetical protein
MSEYGSLGRMPVPGKGFMMELEISNFELEDSEKLFIGVPGQPWIGCGGVQ